MRPCYGWYSTVRGFWFTAVSLSLLTGGCGGGVVFTPPPSTGVTTPASYTRPGTDIQITFENTNSQTAFTTAEVTAMDNALSVIPTPQLEHSNWIAAEPSDAPSTGEGVVLNLPPPPFPVDAVLVIVLLDAGIGRNVYQNVLSPVEQSERQTLDSAPSATAAEADFGALNTLWLTSSAATFSVNLFSAAQAGIDVPLEEDLFMMAALFVSPDNTISLYFLDPLFNSSTVTAMTVSRTAAGFSMSTASSGLPIFPTYQFTLSSDGTTITSVTFDGQTYVLNVPIPETFLAYLNRLPISAAANW